MSHSLFFATINEKFAMLMKKHCGTLYYNSGIARATLSNNAIWDSFRDYLGKLCLLAKDNKTRLIMMTQPLYLVSKSPGTFWEDKRLWHEHYKRTNDIIRQTARKYNIECLDIARVFDMMNDNEKKALFTDVVHLTDKGNAVIARIIAEKLK